jgi:RNA polymerase sigma-70 factor (ECF subfamily)
MHSSKTTSNQSSECKRGIPCILQVGVLIGWVLGPRKSHGRRNAKKSSALWIPVAMAIMDGSRRLQSIPPNPRHYHAMADSASPDEFHALIRRVRQGDQEAASQLVRDYESLVRREVRVRLADRRLWRVLDSMDVCQSVMASFFVRAAMGEYEVDDPRQMVKLLVGMTRNKVASTARRENTQKRDLKRTIEPDDDPLAIPAQQDTPSQLVANAELLARVRELLPQEDQRIAELRAQGYRWEEVAAQMGGTAQARRVQFARSMQKVRVQMGIDEA